MKSIIAFLFASVLVGSSVASTPLLLSPENTITRDRNPDHYCRRPNASCVQLGCFYNHCDFDSEIERITEVCQGVWDDGCIRTLCNHRGDCSFIRKFIKYAELCGGKNP